MAFVGLRDLHFAVLLTDDAAGATYETPEKISGAITAKLNPNTASGTLFGDDGPMVTATSLGEIELELNVTDLKNSTQAKLLGHTVDAKGILLRKASDVPPYVAVGYRSLKDNGEYRYTWLCKGKFKEPEQSHETKTNDVNFQTPTISGSFLRREFDDLWQKTIDSDDELYEAGTGTAWFTSVETVVIP